MRYKLGGFVLLVLICILCFYNIRMIQENDRMKKSNTGVQEEDIPYTYADMYRKTPTPDNRSDTITNVEADANESQRLYLWNENNVPTISDVTQYNGDYFDDPDFVPYLTSYLVPKDTKIKGAVLLCAGGAFSFRGNYTDTIPVAQELNKLGFQCFVVDYRLRPYTQQEGALDLARAVRFVRKNADIYGIDSKHIAVMGFSAGGIQAGELLINFDGLTNGTSLDSTYVPDTLDEIVADACAVGMIYSFYGRLSVASKDVDQLRNANLPPTYFCYGTEDPFVSEFEANLEALESAGVQVNYHILEDTPHGFGPYGGWITPYANWLETIFNDG